MGRPRIARHPKSEAAEPEVEDRELPEDEQDAEPEESGGKAPSKADMVRAAVAEGIEKPQEGVDFIKARFGVEMGKPMFSSYRAQQKARERKAAGEPAAARRSSVAAPPRNAAPGGIVADIADIRRLLATHGKEGLRELIEVLG